ncbi:MAG: hypothetical protein ACL93V_17110 [Candidatus Electrothrix sp. YB6]
MERIVQGIEKGDSTECACVHAVDVYIQFPNGLTSPSSVRSRVRKSRIHFFRSRLKGYD